ncbi:MAG TPA: N-acetylmuramoyl-L-alanine amidase [Steroidobacteraceae bacterium]|jgi:N-acetylmuramoyl-L-alanine amidase
MIRKVFRHGFAATLLCCVLSPSLSATELRGLRLSADEDSAQLALDLTAKAPQKLFRLSHPDRVVIDLRNTHRVSGLRAPSGTGAVSAVRFGTQPGGTLRIVVELKSPLNPKSTWAGRQLLVNLGSTPGGGAAAAAAASATRAAAPQSLTAAHAPSDGGRDVVIAVDAGHGGQDPGATGLNGTREKDVTLAIAQALAERINAEPGMRAVLTRDRDEFLELRDRIHRARVARADMFISVHADSIADRSITGASVYVLSVHGASSEAARWLAERENAVDLMGGVRLDDKGALAPVLLDATQSEIIGVSASAAERVVGALENVGEVRKAQVQHAGFVVLKSPDIPSMLVETAYISNPAEERRLRTASQQSRLADAIASGVRSFFVQNPPDGTRFKQERRNTLASTAEEGAADTR